MNELENHPFHSDSMAHYDACYGGHNINERTKTHACVLGYDMTCKDCKHYEERASAEWYTFNNLGVCDTACSERIIVNEDCPVNKWCDNKFEPKVNSWESVSK